ncbi:MAG: DUF1360 domain-containing protein [Dehalococcoidia bacterium]|nr:DUF1360 domain-containing protein [Dehalococcoidia bacterium]
MPDFWLIILIILATWRIVTFLQDEAGPWDFMRKLRERLGVIHDGEGTPIGWPDTLAGNLFKCFWCLSFWVGILMYLLSLATFIIPLIFAISAGAILIEEIIQRLKNGNRNT